MLPMMNPPPPSPPSDAEVVQLVGGPIVSVAALRVVLALELRGCTSVSDPGCRLSVQDGKLHIDPPSTWTLTDEDRAQIRQYREEIVKIVSYRAPCEPIGTGGSNG